MGKRLSWMLFLAFGVVFLQGCGDSFSSIEENAAPLIMLQGPEFPDGRLEFLEPDGSDYPELWVAVGDPDGLDDISAVLLDIDTIRITELIIRPSIVSTCVQVDFTSTVIPTDNILPLPHSLPSVHDKRMYNVQGGIYSISPFYIPSVENESPVLDRPIHGCGSGAGFWDCFSLNPPAVETAADVFLTRMVVQFKGVSVTVYDAGGKIKRTSFPDLEILYSTDAEEAIAP